MTGSFHYYPKQLSSFSVYSRKFNIFINIFHRFNYGKKEIKFESMSCHINLRSGLNFFISFTGRDALMPPKFIDFINSISGIFSIDFKCTMK